MSPRAWKPSRSFKSDTSPPPKPNHPLGSHSTSEGATAGIRATAVPVRAARVRPRSIGHACESHRTDQIRAKPDSKSLVPDRGLSDPGVARTRDLHFRKVSLYPTELRGRCLLWQSANFPSHRVSHASATDASNLAPTDGGTKRWTNRRRCRFARDATLGNVWTRQSIFVNDVGDWSEKGSGTNSQMARRVFRTIGT
mgnify:CR=1 FL=1